MGGAASVRQSVGGTQAYLVVKSDIKETVLKEGYVCRRRNKVPCHRDLYRGVMGMLDHEKEDKGCSSVALEIHGVPPEWISESTNDSQSGGCSIVTTDFKDGKMWLKPEYIRSGALGPTHTRKAAEYIGKTCMYCNSDEHLDKAYWGKIGEARFEGDALLCSPCSNPDCLVKMRDRSKRLQEGQILELYHLTSRSVADDIIEVCHGRMIRGDFFHGPGGAAGGGIYFGHTPRECWWKAEADGKEVCFKCRVKLGTPLECPFEYKGPPGEAKPASNEMFRHLQNLPHGPCDSVILDRAARPPKAPVFPVPLAPVNGTRIEDVAIGDKLHPGYEFVVYSWDQVEVIAEVELDPPPIACKFKTDPDGSKTRTA